MNPNRNRSARAGIDLRASRLNFVGGGEAGPVKVSGYASVFDVDDRNGTRIARGAFSEFLSTLQRPIPIRYEHALPNIGKATLSEDDYGLRFDGELTPGHSKAADVAAEIAHGTVDGVSIGYWWPAAQNREDRDGVTILKRVEVFEVSLTSTPANPEARIDVRASISEAESLADVERLLRDAAGLSRSEACALVSRVRTIVRGERAEGLSRDDEAAKIAAMIQSFKLP